ncbi:MAG: DUF2953 domain-containing protein [Lachnospiraceae bacterium]|nr:DUF2953 domain-containing protein [Lachnospiraceae bacterium]
MLHVILQILGIIGIVLLCLLGLLIFLILLVLFVPIRYRLIGHKDEITLVCSARVTYLLHLLSVRFDYPEPGSLIIRVFGFRIFDTQKAAKAETSEHEYSEKEARKENKTILTADVPAESVAEEEKNSAKTDEENDFDLPDSSEESPKSSEDDKKKKTFKERINEIFQKIQYTIRSICDKIKSSLQKAEELKETVTYYKKTFEQLDRKLIRRVKKRLFKLLRIFKPRVLKADLHIGTGSPDTTGYLCAVYGMFSPVLGNNVKITPDFEEAVWEGRVYIKGRFTIFSILSQAVMFVLDKQLMTFIKALKREEK